jgi:hypothetical protein
MGSANENNVSSNQFDGFLLLIRGTWNKDCSSTKKIKDSILHTK